MSWKTSAISAGSPTKRPPPRHSMPTVAAMSTDYIDGFYASDDGLALYYRRYTPSLTARNTSSASGQSLSPRTILCLPGVSRNHRDFLPMIETLPPGSNWLLIDLRGRGHSAYDANPANYNPTTYVKDIVRLLDHLQLDCVDIVGTSLGGILAMMLNAQQPARVGNVVLNDIGAFVERAAIETIGSYLQRAHLHTSWDSVATAIKPIYSEFFTGLAEHDWLALARRLYRQRPDGKLVPDYDPALFQSSSATDLDLWPFFDSLKTKPTLIVRGANSGLLTPSILQQMEASRSDLQVITVPNRGHAPFLDEPAAITAIKTFFATASP